MLLAFVSWWYGRGWKQVVASFKLRVQAVTEAFSVAQLSKTMFAPWRRIITPHGRSLEDRLRAVADNMFSRVIGFIVRFFVLLGAVIVLGVVMILTVVETAVWPLVPLALPGLVVAGFVV